MMSKAQPDDDSGDANASKTLNEKPPDGHLYEEAPGLQEEEPGLQKEGPGLQKEKPGLHKVPGAQQARPVCPSPRGVHG